MKIPFLRPNPPKLSELAAELAGIEASGIFSNYGPVNTAFEQQLQQTIFGGIGACVTVCNATIGLMMAIKHCAGATSEQPGRRRFALMPSFTFAATAHAALWCGLTPLLCDIDEESWLPSAAAEQDLLERYGSDIAVVVPYATFGNNLDLAHYDRLSKRYKVPVVVDAAASLGSLTDDGVGFGSGCRHPVVFSLHTTKPFATLEGGLIYCADLRSVAALRAMGNFGFAQPRTATMPGLNAKLSEVTALLGLRKLTEFERVVRHRVALAEAYHAALPGWTFQRMHGPRHAYTFMPALLPEQQAERRQQILARLAAQGIGAGTYFSPHLAEQPYFRETCTSGDLAATRRIGRRIVSLPLSDRMTADEVGFIGGVLRDACGEPAGAPSARGARFTAGGGPM